MTIDINELRDRAATFGSDYLTDEEWVEVIDRLESAESDALEQSRLNGMGASREAALMAKLEAAEKSDAESVAMYRKARDERDKYKSAYTEWCEKTEWVQDGISNGSISPTYLGWHRADIAHDLLKKAENERDALQAKIEQMEKQEPYSYIYEYSNPIDGSPVWRDKPGYWNAQFPKSSKPLYLAPGAQPAPNLPVDLITDYLVSVSAHVAHQDDTKAQAEIGELLRMLAAAQEVKSCI